MTHALTPPAARPVPGTPGIARDPAAGLPDAAGLQALTDALAELAPRIDAEGRFPHEAFALLRHQGLLALTVPRAFGGAGATLAEARRLVAAVARGEPATALVLVMQLLVARTLGRDEHRWPAEPRQRVLRSLVEEGALINHLRVEPELGTPARGGLPGTVARRTDAGWRIDGHKRYATGIDGLRWLLVWARTDETPPRCGAFLVPADAAGVRIDRTWDHLGLRGSASDDVLLQDVAVPADHAIDLRPAADGAGPPDADQASWTAVLLGTVYDAIAHNAQDWLLDFLRHRQPSALGRPLAELPRVQEAVGEIALRLHGNQRQLDAAAAAADAGLPWPLSDSGLLKVDVTRRAIEAVELALRQSGNHGLSRLHPLQRFHRDVLCGRVHTPQDDSACVAAGRALLAGAPR